MRRSLLLILPLTLACSGDKADDTASEGGLSVHAGLEGVLGDLTGTTIDYDIWNLDASCEAGSWSFDVELFGFEGDPVPDRVIVVAWDLVQDRFSGGWELSPGADEAWTGSVDTGTAGVSCEAPGASNFVAIPMLGTVAGGPKGAGVMGDVGGYSYVGGGGDDVAVELYTSEADAAWWRQTDLYDSAAGAEGSMDAGEDGWSTTLADFGWESDGNLAPILGMWGTLGGEGVGSCAL